MIQKDNKKWRQFMRFILDAIIWMAALTIAFYLFLSFQNSDVDEEVQSNSIEIAERTVDDNEGAVQTAAAWQGNADYDVQANGNLADTEDADAGNNIGYVDIFLQMDNGVTSQNIKMYIKDDKCYFFLPTCSHSYRFRIQYQEDKYEIRINGKQIANGESIAYEELAKQHTLVITSNDGNETEKGENQQKTDSYSLEFRMSENLPVIFIETANKTMEYIQQAKTNKEVGEMICILPDGSIDCKGKLSIHARGSSSFESACKKSYKINLEETVDVLSMGKGNKWVLQANALDSTKIRNGIAYKFARNLQLGYAVDSTYADVYFNGEYGGSYLVCEPVELGENRIAIDEENSYLLAIDRAAPGDDSFTDQFEQMFVIKYPEENIPEKIEYLRQRINVIEDLISTCDTWEKYQNLQEYIDIDSFVDMYLMNAIANETDANAASCYFYIDGKDGKLYAGPAWDYDRAWGNAKGKGSYRFNVYWNGIPEQLSMIPYFEQDIQNKLRNSQNALMQLIEDVDTMSNEIRASVSMERVIYGDTDSGFVETGDYDAEVAFLKYYVENRIDWMSDIILHSDTYHHVFINSDKIGLTYWVKDGETIPAADLAYIYAAHYCDSLLFENGSTFWDGYPILSDIVLYEHNIEETADEIEETDEEETVEKNVMAVAETDKEMLGMGLLAFIMILAPGFIVLFISMNWNDERSINKIGLLIQYFCYDFLILLFVYGSVYLVKGAITLSLSGGGDNSFDYTIYNVNVVFIIMMLELIGACILGSGIRIYRKLSKRWKD